MNKEHAPLVLIILDGWGYRESSEANAIAQANTPYWDKLWQQYPHTLIHGSGHYVGLPDKQMGNSEVGHLNISAGRIVAQDYTRIESSIESEEFYESPVLLKAMAHCKKQDKALHVLGLLSPGGVHSHELQIHALISMAARKQVDKVYIHAFLDGRDTPPKSAATSISNLEAHCQEQRCGKIVSLIGRYYAMDRDKRWDRVEQCYDLLTQGIAKFHVESTHMGLELAYARGETDEFIAATAIHHENEAAIKIEEDDCVVFMNFRADRAREISHALTDDDFDGFERKQCTQLASFITLTQYASDIVADVVFPAENVHNTFGEVLANHNLSQLRIAETEKYAHVTYFFSGGNEELFPGEVRLLIQSPDVATYDLQPEMSAVELTDQLIEAITGKHYAAIICNFANPDMVGHTGDFEATKKAIETIDQCLERIIAALQTVGGEALITADHGNAEQMFNDKSGQAHTAHTTEQVPCLYIGRTANISKENGQLADIAPTLLHIMGLDLAEEMTGESLFQLNEAET